MWVLLHAAVAADVTTGIAGGLDDATAQPWTGLQLAVYPTQHKGVGGLARVAGGYGFADRAPLLFLEGGATVVIPQDEAIVRLGLLGRLLGTSVPYGLPLQPRNANPGLIPAGAALIEFAWPHPASDTKADALPFAFGARIGVGAVAQACPNTDADDACVSWRPGLMGGAHVRVRYQHLHAEALAGTDVTLSVGYAW